MSAQKMLILAVCLITLTFLFNTCLVEGRYLPTRGNNDRLDKLKELLKETELFQLLENEIEKDDFQPEGPPRWHPESKLFYKREVPAQ